ncbi:MAG: flagellar export chaperone FliS [Deltaproteobacteria bacterium]|nr:flagellar export chaperone FliS [Deltaproteobacteria bacterium]
MYENAVKSYQQTSFLTADPLRLVLMCYDKAISSLKQAKESFAAKDYEAKGLALKKALDILHELNASLDLKKGGEIAVNLRTLYTFMSQALIEADLKRDLAVFDSVIQMLEELEVEWKGISTGGGRDAKPAMNGIIGRTEMTHPKMAMAGRAWSA